MNQTNLDKLIAHLETLIRVSNTQTFNMLNWYQGYTPYGTYASKPFPTWAPTILQQMYGKADNPDDNFNCHTVACLAGHCALLFAAENGAEPKDPQTVATNWLELTHAQSQDLFQPWSDTFLSAISIDKALECLRRFKTDGYVTWNLPGYRTMDRQSPLFYVTTEEEEFAQFMRDRSIPLIGRVGK